MTRFKTLKTVFVEAKVTIDTLHTLSNTRNIKTGQKELILEWNLAFLNGISEP